MKFTLKDYQGEAVSDVLDRLKKARKRWHDDGEKHAFSLTATTGAGKTVMAAAVFEALFFGDDEYEFERDPGAVVIWFSDDPSLNEQSKFRLQEASDKLTVSDLVTIDNSFVGEKLHPGKVYFLNTQKLSKNSLLVRGHDADDPALETISGQQIIMPDMRQLTIWDVVKNTIEDPELTLYLVLDEAHRGMQEGNSAGRQTIVKQLINGTGGVPGAPIVWGISATVERFNAAIADMEGRTTLPAVKVDAQKVQESGLLKDTIVLDIPDETGNFSTVLLRRATTKLREISEAWADYAKQQKEIDTVLPLMVLQVPNTPDHNEVSAWLDVIFEEWPDLPRESIAHVFGQHTDQVFGRYNVPYISPERVEEKAWIRILIAKDAISTGWDCPRAEVMVSFRSANDRTHITQLLGRMVRTPLARRIPGNERLNSVDCLLPKFNKETVKAVVTHLTTGEESGEELLGRRILINPQEMLPNPEISEEVWHTLLSLPSQSLPKRQIRPIKRLTALAHELAVDGILRDAGKKAHTIMHETLDGIQKKYAAEIKAAQNSIQIVEGKTVLASVGSAEMTLNDFVERADSVAIDEVYRSASRVMSPDLANSYSDFLAANSANEDDEDALIDAHIQVAALGLVPEVRDVLEMAAEKMSNEWLRKYRDKIKNLSDERQEVYRQIREMSMHPLDVDLARPQSRLQNTVLLNADGIEANLPRFKHHLLCDKDGTFPVELNGLEAKVFEIEIGRQDLVAWYRNPATASQESLGVSYEDTGEIKMVRPDFIFFSKKSGKVVANIIDPHGSHYADALPKMLGLAEYAEEHGNAYGRIVVCDEIEGVLREINFNEEQVRVEIKKVSSAREAYNRLSHPYR